MKIESHLEYSFQLSREVRVPKGLAGFRAIIHVVSDLGFSVADIAGGIDIEVEYLRGVYDGNKLLSMAHHDKLIQLFGAAIWWHALRMRQNWALNLHVLRTLPGQCMSVWDALPHDLHNDWTQTTQERANNIEFAR